MTDTENGNGVQRTLGMLVAQMEAMNARLAGADQQRAEMRGQIVKLASDVNSVRGDVQAVRGQVEDVQTDVSKLRPVVEKAQSLGGNVVGGFAVVTFLGGVTAGAVWLVSFLWAHITALIAFLAKLPNG